MVRKVAIIIERANITLGGAERSMFETARALSILGLKVDLLAAKGRTSVKYIHVLCDDVPGKRVSLSRFGETLRRHLAHNEYDIVHSILPFDFADLYQPRGGTYAESLRRHVGSYPNPILRLSKRATAFANRRRAELLVAERKLCRDSGGPVVAALSQYVVDQLQEHYAIDPQRVVLTLNGVKINRRVNRKTAARLHEQILSELGAWGRANPVLFLFVAHNFRLKGLDRLIHALRLACRSPTERPACLVVIGGGRSRSYQRLAKRLGVENRILFLGSIKRVQNALSITDVGILPTYYDPSSRFILEALAAGKPVITTRFNGATDHFINGRHGRIIDSPDDLPALAEAIRHFTSAPNVTAASQAILEDQLADKISIRRVANELVGVYESIYERKKRL